MKRILFTLFLICGLTTHVEAQMHFSQWHSSYFSNGYFDIDIDTEMENDKFNVWISVLGKLSNKNCSLIISSDKLPEFIAFLKNTKDKYVEWKNIAIENNVTDMTKIMSYTTPICHIGWYYMDKWYFCFDQTLQPMFMILDDGRMVVTIINEYASSENRYITETIYMAFGAESDFDSLINALDEEAMRAVYASKVNVDVLFK